MRIASAAWLALDTVTGDPTDLVVPVTFPINQPTRVDVFTR